MQISERAQPSLKIKGGMTFNAKKHTETERRWSRDSAGPFIYCMLPEQAFWMLGGVYVCACVEYMHIYTKKKIIKRMIY